MLLTQREQDVTLWMQITNIGGKEKWKNRK